MAGYEWIKFMLSGMLGGFLLLLWALITGQMDKL